MKATCTIWLGVLVAVLAAVGEAAPIPAGPVYTNKPRFKIPFRYDAAEMQTLGAKEIRLYVSRDRGVNWQLIQSVSPDSGKFNFQAPADGEYWFNVKTLDSKDRLHPEINPTEPGLQVVVDSIPPSLKLELKQPSPGRVQLNWNAADEHLDPAQLRLEYIQPGTPNWQAVSIVPKASGQTEWTIPQGGVVAVRGTIADLARNAAQDQAQVVIAPADQAVPRPAVPDFRQPIASPGSGAGGNLAQSMPDKFVAVNPAAGGVSALAPTVGMATPFSAAMPTSGTARASSSFASMHQGVPAGDGVDPDFPATKQAAPARYRIVNTRQFQIGYKLQDVGPSGVGGVELYITPDDGASWYKYGDDPDNQSPVSVEVPREGTYGFALGVKSGAGLTTEPPQPGEKPAIVVVVDQTPPRLELLPLEQGRGRAINKILIPWRFSDDYPAEKPISLSYSATGQGGWQQITGWQENTGSYVWTVGPNVPSRFYLRLEGRDAAGNSQIVETPQPVLIDLSRPTARIIDVETSGGR